MAGAFSLTASPIKRLTVPAPSPFNIAICAGSDPETDRVRLLSIAQQRHAPTIANAPHEKPSGSPGCQDSSKPPATMAIIPMRIRRSKFSWNANQAINAVSTPSRLSNREVLEAGVIARPAISKTGATTPPDSIAPVSHAQSEPRRTASVLGVFRRMFRANRQSAIPNPDPR